MRTEAAVSSRHYARSEGGRKPGVLTQEQSLAMYQVTKFYPGETLLSDLRLPPPSLLSSQYRYYGYSSDTHPPASWRAYYLGLSARVRKPISEVLKAAIVAGFETIGAIRETPVEELHLSVQSDAHFVDTKTEQRRTRPPSLSAFFLKEAFGPEMSVMS